MIEIQPSGIGPCLARAVELLGLDTSVLDEAVLAEERTPAQWLGLAAQMGMDAEVRACSFANIPPSLSGPLVAFLDDGEAVLLVKRGGKEGWLMEVPGEGGDLVGVSESIRKRYQGFLMVLQHRKSVGDAGGSGSGAEGAQERARRWLWSGLGQLKFEMLYILMASLVIHLVALGTPLITMVMYDRVVPNRAFETLWTVTAGGLALFGFDFLVRLLRGRFADAAGKAADHVLSAGLVKQLLAMEIACRPASAGGFAARLRQYEPVREFLTSAVLVSLIDAPVAFLLTGLIFWLGGSVGWIPVLFGAIALGATLLLQPWQRRLMKDSFALNIDRQALTVEVVNGLESIKAANAEMETEGRLREMEADCARVDLKMRRVNLLGNSMTVLCMNLTTLGVLVGCVHQILELEMTMGAMIACSMVAGRAMAPLMGMAGLLLRFQQTMTSLKSLMGIMQMPREDERPLLRLPLRHPSFRLDQVTLTYTGQPIPSLRQVSLQIKAGERVGVIGRAGSGKTTLLRLLGRLLLPSEGLLLVDGVDVRQVHPAQIRQVCGYLPQDPVLFHGTVRENILLGRSKGVSDETFTRAAARAGLLEWVNRHPNGFDLQVGERGILLSGGQRQAVAAARVMLTEPDVLFMDEPAANFDITSEKQFREALGDYLSEDPKRTLVLATHKMSLLSLVDRLIVLEMGQVVADGPRELVLAKLQGKALPDKSEGGKEEAI